MSGNDPPSHFDGHDGSNTFKEGDHDDAHHKKEFVLFLRTLAHAGSERADESVAKQDAEEGADESGSDFVANLLRRTTESAHGDDDAEDRGDYTQPRQ